MFNQYDVVQAKNKLSDNVPAGCKGAVLVCFENNDYEVEFVDDAGESIAVMTVPATDLEMA